MNAWAAIVFQPCDHERVIRVCHTCLIVARRISTALSSSAVSLRLITAATNLNLGTNSCQLVVLQTLKAEHQTRKLEILLSRSLA